MVKIQVGMVQLGNLYSKENKDSDGKITSVVTRCDLLATGGQNNVTVSPGVEYDKLVMGVFGTATCEFEWKKAEVFEYGKTQHKFGLFPVRLLAFVQLSK